MRPHPGPSLPLSILEEIDKASGQTGLRKGVRGKLSRKEARKQGRDEKRQRRADFFAPGTKRGAEHEHEDSPKQKRVRLFEDAQRQTNGSARPSVRPAKTKQQPATAQRQEVKPKKGETGTALQKLAERGAQERTTPRLPPTPQEHHDDAYIAYLESKLGWAKGGKKTSKYGSGLEEDGLDDLLRDVESIEASLFSTSKPNTSYDDTDEEAEEGSMEEESEEDGMLLEQRDGASDVSEGSVSRDEEMDQGDVLDSQDEGTEDEWTGFGDETSEEQDPTGGILTVPAKPIAAGSRYVPPHLRNSTASEELSEVQIKLTRQLKGLLNRMSEQNISTILEGTEELYRNHRRHGVTSTITKLIIDGISSHSILLDTYVLLHAALIASLHKVVGVEFAAHFVQNVVVSYEKHFAELNVPAEIDQGPAGEANNETRGKECSNLIVLLSELYNFQVISCLLVYDLIRGLLNGELTEFKVELLLKIVRNSGQQLRTDDPSALKDIIQIVHSKLPAQQNALSSRTRFMIETLTNLKNNKLKRNTAGAAGPDAGERMKKFLSSLNKKRNVVAHDALRVSLADLHAAGTKGKWWLVGAAWGGDPLVDKQEEIQQSAKKTESVDNILLKLARKQGMNTDIRRNIFVVMMSSEDYVDACERLSQLKLTEVQQREIVRVLLHCCGNEKAYNPYYALVAQQLCRTSHSYKVTLQFCLWDLLRDMGETGVGGVEVLKNLKDDSVSFDVGRISRTRASNVARAYAWWIAKESCTLAILKPVDFTALKPQSQEFFTELFTHLLADTQLSTPLLSSDPQDLPTTRNRGPLEEVFIKATRVETLALGLVYFLGQVYTKEQEQKAGSGFIHWAVKIAVDTLRTGIDIVATI